MTRYLRYIFSLLFAIMQIQHADAQQFFNLSADEVKIDSVLPRFYYTKPLPANHKDSIYNVSVAYPEYVDMPEADIERYKAICPTLPPQMPEIDRNIVFDRKKPLLETSFCPVVYSEGRYRLLVSFMLKVEAVPAKLPLLSPLNAPSAAQTEPSQRYAEHSVLAGGRWAKIRVKHTGVYQLTESLIRQAGFTDINKVRVYGYGGNLRSEVLSASDITGHDDLKEVAQCVVNGRHLFHAKGPVSWQSNSSSRRTRNPYSDYGYYFITQSDEPSQPLEESAFISSFYPSADDYHSIHEVDGFSWFHGGRNLFDSKQVSSGSSHTVTIAGNPSTTAGRFSINVSSSDVSSVQVAINDSVVGTISLSKSDDYDTGCEASATYRITNAKASNDVKFTVLSGNPVRLDYVSVAWNEPFAAPDLAASTFPVPEYVYNITNQDLHSDGPADMIIIIPTSQKWRSQAERLKTLRETNDGLRVRIVPADELYNEFSSGTPDASAYRHYLKMLYDRAETEADMPRYLLLFGDCVWDNRMLTSNCRTLSPDDYLLCYESENSFNQVKCYIDDGFFCMLDDGEGLSPLYRDKLDVAVGRIPVTNEHDAKTVVDKIVAYTNNRNAGVWQNTLMFMGDDGNYSTHMQDVDDAAEMVEGLYPGFIIKKVMWDAYKRMSSSVGHSYPDASRVVKQQQQQGALIMDYAGHGRADQISHEQVLRLSDFAGFTNTNLPLWITASCDIMPFDGTSPTIGETALLNAKGGSVAFYGTTRTVYAMYNKRMNMNFLREVLKYNNGKPQTMGEAQRIAKNSVASAINDEVVNNLQYSLLGDPSMPLNLPSLNIVVDSINDISTSSGETAHVHAGSLMKVKGHVDGAPDFNGIVTAVVRDSRELVTCLWNNRNDKYGDRKPFTYYDRPGVLFNGNDSVRGGEFEFTFAVPMDISFSNLTGLINLYAVSGDHKLLANGSSDRFVIGGSDVAYNDSIGPSIYCYLNSPSFANGDKVNTTPYFVAQISDKDGINASGNSIGHDLQLIIDGKTSRTYVLNDNFSYDFGSYTRGSVYYNIPELEPGEHSLLFRAWDILNNPSTAELRFNVVRGLTPRLFNISCTENPATTGTTFIITHDRTGSSVDIAIDVLDMSGRLLWTHTETGVSTDNTYTVDWDLSIDGGARLQTGVYLYRVRMGSEGGNRTSKAKKLIIIGNK